MQVGCSLNLTNVISLDNSKACVILNASGSSDAESPLSDLTFQWFVVPSPLPFAVGVVATNCFDLGCQTVLLVVTDPQGMSCSTSVNLCAISACEAVQQCIDLVDNATVERKNKRPLIATLKAACASFDRGDFIPAMNELQAFQNKVAAQIARANPNEAAAFITCAQQILDAIQCGAAAALGGH